MSSPMVRIFHPSSAGGGTSIARFVFPDALGNAPATKCVSPSGLSASSSIMCSASQPSFRAW